MKTLLLILAFPLAIVALVLLYIGATFLLAAWDWFNHH